MTFAHANNRRFQKNVQLYFFGIPSCHFQAAPIKLFDRCVVKATSDYQDKEFPSVANIVDFMRFSVTFDNIESLLDGLNKFITDVNNGDNKYLSNIFLSKNGILRIKNGFKNIINKWESYNDAEYCDIKINLIYKNNISNENSQQMIVEAQFLLKFLMKAKKMGHKLYSLIRQDEFISNIKNEVYNMMVIIIDTKSKLIK